MSMVCASTEALTHSIVFPSIFFKFNKFTSLTSRSMQGKAITHLLFYKNIVYKNVKPQLWGYLKNIFIAETAFSSNFNAFLRTNALFWHG